MAREGRELVEGFERRNSPGGEERAQNVASVCVCSVRDWPRVSVMRNGAEAELGRAHARAREQQAGTHTKGLVFSADNGSEHPRLRIRASPTARKLDQGRLTFPLICVGLAHGAFSGFPLLVSQRRARVRARIAAPLCLLCRHARRHTERERERKKEKRESRARTHTHRQHARSQRLPELQRVPPYARSRRDQRARRRPQNARKLPWQSRVKMAKVPSSAPSPLPCIAPL